MVETVEFGGVLHTPYKYLKIRTNISGRHIAPRFSGMIAAMRNQWPTSLRRESLTVAEASFLNY